MLDICRYYSESYRSMVPSRMTMYFNLPPDVISLGVGESGFSTPKEIAAGGIRSIENGRTFYPPSSGYLELRELTDQYLKEKFGYIYDADETLITMGASVGIDCIIRTYIGRGDEVIVPAPAYGYYETQVSLSGGKTVYAPSQAGDGWEPDPDVIEGLISSSTKMIILNYPNNPTGAVLSEKSAERLAWIIERHGLLAISDEIYAEFSYTGKHVSILNHGKAREHTFLVSGFSKSMAMTGWRLGYICAPEPLLDPVRKVNAAVTLCAPACAQYAAAEGLKSGREAINGMISETVKRRESALRLIGDLGWPCIPPGGGFYLWADIRSTGMEAEAFCRHLIREAKVALVHGTVFGNAYNQYVRITFTPAPAVMEEAVRRIRDCLAQPHDFSRYDE